MSKLEDLLNKRNLELDAEKKARDARIRDLSSKRLLTTLQLLGSIIITYIGYYFGILHEDGSLFTGFFMQLIFFLGGGFASVISLIQLLILLAKNENE